MEQRVKERKSIITIILVIFVFIVLAFLTVKILNFYSNTPKESDEKLYYSHLDEEDKMKEEYGYLNDELNGFYAFGICNSNVVAIKGTDEYINITSIDESKEYDYLYYNRKLYLLEKDTGTISVIPLDKEYEIESQINLNCTVDSFEVYDEDVYYISGGILFKYINNQVEEICNKNKKVAMFIDMDGTIVEYVIYGSEKELINSKNNFLDAEPINIVIDKLRKINKIENIDLYILTLAKTTRIEQEKKEWLKNNVEFIDEKRWIIINKEKNEYNKENRDYIKAKKMEEKLANYDSLIFLDDDHKILKKAKSELEGRINVFHISSALV